MSALGVPRLGIGFIAAARMTGRRRSLRDCITGVLLHWVPAYADEVCGHEARHLAIMTTPSLRVTVVTPYLHYDGSSLLLYRFLNWAASAHPECGFDILYRHDGEVRKKLERLSNVGEVVHLVTKKRRLVHRIDFPLHRRKLRRLLRTPNAVYCNTVPALRWLEDFIGTNPDLDLPKATIHVRELGYWIQRSGVSKESFLALNSTIIADSSLTGDNLQSTLGISDYTVIDEYCDVKEVQKWRGEDLIRKEFDIPQSRHIVGMAGTIEWRKGPDLFLMAAKQLSNLMERPPLFVWVGGFVDTMFEYQMRKDIQLLGLESTVMLLGSKENPYPYYDSMDLFALTSREEPFGAVCLEAGALEIPSICYRGCAGAESFISRKCGVVVERSDVNAMAIAIKDLLEDANRRKELGSQARHECEERHSLETLLPKLLEMILSRSVPVP